MQKKRSRILSLLLALCLCLTLCPAASAATEDDIFPAAFQGDGYYISATPYELQGEGWYIDDTNVREFREGLLRVYRNAQAVDDHGYYAGTYRQVGYADKTGKVVLTFDDWEEPPASADLLDGGLYFSEGMCAYYDRSTGRFGYINAQGESVISAQYKYTEPFQDGLAFVVDGENKQHFIDKSGQIVPGLDGVANNQDMDLGGFSEGLVAAKGWMENGDYFVGFLDKQGQPAITIYLGERSGYSKDEYLSVQNNVSDESEFSDGYAILYDYRGGRKHPAYVVIDAQGNEVSVIDAEPPAYAYIYGVPKFSEGLIQVDFVDTDGPGTGTECYVDIHGDVAFELPEPASLHGPMLSGLAVIGGIKMIDQTGTMIIPDYDDVLDKLLPILKGSALGYGVDLDNMYGGIGLAKVQYGLDSYYYLLEKHEGTYTGPGLVYDALTGTIRDNGTAPVDPEPEPAGDQPSSWAQEQVNAAINAGLVPESLQSKYTQTATRAEFCALAVELYETVTGSEITERATFSDTSDVNVQKMAGIGVISGIGNNQFDPNGELTREQAATILVRLADALGQPLPEGTASFADNSSISSWALESVGRAKAGGIMDGTGNNRFSPQGAYTREQSIMTAYRLFETMQ